MIRIIAAATRKAVLVAASFGAGAVVGLTPLAAPMFAAPAAHDVSYLRPAAAAVSTIPPRWAHWKLIPRDACGRGQGPGVVIWAAGADQSVLVCKDGDVDPS